MTSERCIPCGRPAFGRRASGFRLPPSGFRLRADFGLGIGFRGGSALLRFGGTAEAAVATRILLGFRRSRLRLAVLVDEGGVFLVAFGGEADVVELDFIHAELGYVLGEGDVVVLDRGVRGIGPDQLAVLAPRGVVLAGLDGQFGMLDDQALVAEHGDAGDGVHVLLVQEMHEFRDVMQVDVVLAEQRMFPGNGHAAVGVLDIEDDRVAADFAPVADDAESVIAAGHDAGEVDGADFKVFGDRDGVLDDGRGEDSGNDDVFVVLENVARVGFVVGGADGVGELGGRQVRGAAEVAAGDRGDSFSTLRGVDLGAGSGDAWAQEWSRSLRSSR